MQQCGFCSMISGLLRRAMCVGSRRGSGDSYYRELGDQDTLKIEDKESDNTSEDSQRLNRDGILERSLSEDLKNELSEMKDHSQSTDRFLTMHKRRKKRLLTRSLGQDAGLLDDLQLGNVQCILDQSVQWRFNAFTLENVSGGRCLPVLCVHLFHVYGLLTHFKLDVAKAMKLFSLIEEGYHSTNPYHNTVHAADVTQAMHCFLQQDKIRFHMEPLEIMASLIAAIAHDVDHPGVNQPFLIATSNHLAALYRNTSVLENHHWRLAMSCLIESGLVDQLAEGRSALERQISSLILATDITRQQEYLSQFKTYLDTNTLDLSKREHRHLVLQIALKCADISNPCRPWEISRKWSLKVCEEFFRQGDYERRLHLPVTALCDRHTTSIPKIQTGFFKFVVGPLIGEWHRFLQNDLSSQMLKNLVYNQSKWEMLVAQEIAEETRTEISDADMVENELETGSSNMSDSSEPLLPLRRGSLAPTRPRGLRDHLRRFSVPLNVFQDSKFKSRDKNRASSQPRSAGSAGSAGSDHSLHSQLSLQGHCTSAGAAAAAAEKLLSREKLLPDSSIASITTPRQATRLSCVLKDGGAGSWKLIRQQTFPPLESAARALGDESALYPPRFIKTEIGQNITETSIKESIFSNIFKRYTDKTDNDDASENNNVAVTPSEKENMDPVSGRGGGRRESAPVGSQLRENLAALHRGSLPADLLRRRKSMPPEGLLCVSNDKKMREVTCALLGRTLSGKEWWAARRGSAPVALAAGGRKPGAVASCQQWLAKASLSVPGARHRLPRRSSLPVEVLTGGPPF